MEAGDIRADDVDDFTFRILPILLELAVIGLEITQSGDVVGQSIEPDIDDVARCLFDGDTPIKGGAGNAEIVEAWLDEIVHHLGLATFRGDEFWILIVKSQQILHVFVTAEEIRRLAFFFARPSALGAKMLIANHLSVGPIGFFVDAVPAFISRKIDIVVFGKCREDLLNGFIVARLGRADEVIVRDAKDFPKIEEFHGDVIDELLRSDPGGFGVVFDFLAMFVQTGQKIGIETP
jgi:hypothetical protein